MFGKLLKYEFKAPGKWYLSLYAIAGLLSVILGFWVRTMIQRDLAQTSSDSVMTGSGPETVFFVFMIIAFVVLIVSLMFATFFLVVSRFYSNVYGRQGYLTMTLPISSHQLILSKLVAALIWYFLATLTVLLGLILIGLLSLSSDTQALNEFMRSFLVSLPNMNNFPIFEMITYLFSNFVSTTMSILVGYFAISLGQLFRDHRILLAIAFFIGLQFVVGIIQYLSGLATVYTYSETNISIAPNPFFIGVNILLAIGFYFGTHFIMTKKLNLQ